MQGIPDTAHQNMWLMHDVAPVHFSNTASILHIPGGGLDGVDLLLDFYAPQTSIPWISSGAGGYRVRISWHLLQLTSPARVFFNAPNIPLSVGVDYVMINVGATWNNFCNKHVLHFCLRYIVRIVSMFYAQQMYFLPLLSTLHHTRIFPLSPPQYIIK
ncbi:hypothetical protein TNCV_3993331 [Trichonephila clavipes]|uniref:Uncharacterized protein n=1 Tax=Trichonephila clavipes TaxID=2585209 RepID=A0A8X6VP99_TRICX|nr:hypothetical protein TNCV_3993331 [Trichonephila clavipes]